MNRGRAAERSRWSRVATCFRPYHRELVASAVLIVVLAAVAALQPLLLRTVIDSALPHRRVDFLMLLCLAMILAGGLSALIGTMQAGLFTRAAQSVAHDLRAAVYDRMASASIPEVSERAGSATQARLVGDIGVIDDEFAVTIQSVAWSVTVLMSLGITMVVISWPLALLSLAIALLLALSTRSVSLKQYRLAERRQDAQQSMMKSADENLSLPGIILGRTFGRVAAQRDLFLQQSRTVSSLRTEQRMLGRSSFAIVGLAFSAIPPVIYLTAGTLLPSVSIGSIVVIATMQMRLSAPIQEILTSRATIQSTLVAFDRVLRELAEQQVATTPRVPETQTGVPAGSGLVAAGVCYRYPGADRDALHDVDFCRGAGSVTFICGDTGSGKSTFALLVAGLIEPCAGSITVGGQVPASPESCCLVPQESVMFNTSIRDNLAFAAPWASDAQMTAVLRELHLGHLVDRSPAGLDAQVGERGYQISGGERQRLALARALLRDPAVLILDESTSALDTKTQQHVLGVVRRHCRTRVLILVAHQLTSVEASDSMFLLRDGQLHPSDSFAA